MTARTEFGMPMVRQLIEIDAARQRDGGPGIGPEVQELISRLTSGGISPGIAGPTGKRRKKKAKLPDRDPRILRQAKRLWDKGWGRELRIGSYVEYLSTIPDIPTPPVTWWDVRFPHLVLVDRRVTIVTACQLLSVHYGGTHNTFVPYESARSIKDSVYWIRVQDVNLYRDRRPDDCRTEFTVKGDEIGVEAHEGIALYAQNPDLLEVGTAWDFLGSVPIPTSKHGVCPYLNRSADLDAMLIWDRFGTALSNYSSISRGSADLSPRS